MLAKDFAIQHHGSQQYGALPYGHHLEEVVQILHEAGFGHLQDAGYLHDVLEDTQATEAQLLAHFGEFTTEAVKVCTDATGPNRRARKVATYLRVLASRENPSEATLAGLAVKVADRIANVRNCLQENSSLLGMYHKEDPDFRRIYRHPAHQPLWELYEKLW